jgi:hypothetical protein
MPDVPAKPAQSLYVSDNALEDACQRGRKIFPIPIIKEKVKSKGISVKKLAGVQSIFLGRLLSLEACWQARAKIKKKACPQVRSFKIAGFNRIQIATAYLGDGQIVPPVCRR